MATATNERECTDEEKEALEADAAADRAAEQAEDEALRDSWFEFIQSRASAIEDDASGA